MQSTNPPMTADNLTALPDAAAWMLDYAKQSDPTMCGRTLERTEELRDHMASELADCGCVVTTTNLYTEQQVRTLLAARDAERGRLAAVDALAKMIYRDEALRCDTPKAALHHMARWRRATEEASELLATLTRVAAEAEAALQADTARAEGKR